MGKKLIKIRDEKGKNKQGKEVVRPVYGFVEKENDPNKPVCTKVGPGTYLIEH